jgi:hypothetical protein
MISDPKAENNILKEQVFNLRTGITKTSMMLNDKIRAVGLSGDPNAKVIAEAYKNALSIMEMNLDKFV